MLTVIAHARMHVYMAWWFIEMAVVCGGRACIWGVLVIVACPRFGVSSLTFVVPQYVCVLGFCVEHFLFVFMLHDVLYGSTLFRATACPSIRVDAKS